MTTLLLIFTCKKYAHKAQFQRDSWIPCLPPSIRAYHVIGDPERCGAADYLVEDTIIYTRTADDYCSLPHKVITAFQAVHETMSYEYIYKTDDDQVVTDLTFFEEVERQRIGHRYGGHVTSVPEHFSEYWRIHPELPNPLWLEEATYCTGRFYFLSPSAVQLLLVQKEWFASRCIEDHAIGYALWKKEPIEPLHLNDRIKDAIVDMDETYVDRQYYIYTECVNCPEIGLNALLSYQRFHSYPLHVYLTHTDLMYIIKHVDQLNLPLFRWIPMSDDLIDVYQRDGHLATAMLWEKVMSSVKKKIIHVDSDVIFRGDVIRDVMAGLYAHALVGPVRCYRCNLNGREDIRHQPDVVATYCFGFDPSFLPLSVYPTDTLVSMIRGYFTPLPLSILDFFDPMSFWILHQGGKMKIIDFRVIGELNREGSKENGYPLNRHMDCGDKIIHFSSVGSGLTFEKAMQKGVAIHVPNSYVQHSLNTLAIYRYLLFHQDTPERVPQWVREIAPSFQELHSLSFISLANDDK